MIDPQAETVIRVAEILAGAIATIAVVVNRRDLRRYREAERRRKARERRRRPIPIVPYPDSK